MKNHRIDGIKIAQTGACLLLVPIWAWFGYRHVLAFLAFKDWSYLFLCISETLTVGFLLIRTYPKSVSRIPLDWLIAIAGTFSTLLIAPETWGIFPIAKHAVTLGTLLQVLGIISLNRSFAIVAANREIKTGGMYKFVRHPLYTSYFVTFTGYILSNTSLGNILIYVFAMSCLMFRIFREENHLVVDDAYAKYMQKVRYRLIPFVF